MRVFRTAFFVLVALYFALPMLAMARFSFQNVPNFMLSLNNITHGWSIDAILRAFANPGVRHSLALSAQLTMTTAALALFVVVPVATYAEVSAPRLRALLTAVTVMAWLVPPVALVVGVAATFQKYVPSFLSSPMSLTFFYALWVLPFTFRAVDGQLRLIGVRNLFEAAQSVGCTPITFFFRVVAPNLTAALRVSTSLIVAFVLGEFTFASLLLKQTMPVYMAHYETEDTQAGFALALLAMVVTAGVLGIAVSTLRRRGLTLSATGI